MKLLKKSLTFLTKGSTKKDFQWEMVLEVLPKLLITHMVDLCDLKRSVSILAIRRMVNFLRLFRLLIELHPEIGKEIDR